MQLDGSRKRFTKRWSFGDASEMPPQCYDKQEGNTSSGSIIDSIISRRPSMNSSTSSLPQDKNINSKDWNMCFTNVQTQMNEMNDMYQKVIIERDEIQKQNDLLKRELSYNKYMLDGYKNAFTKLEQEMRQNNNKKTFNQQKQQSKLHASDSDLDNYEYYPEVNEAAFNVAHKEIDTANITSFILWKRRDHHHKNDNNFTKQQSRFSLFTPRTTLRSIFEGGSSELSLRDDSDNNTINDDNTSIMSNNTLQTGFSCNPKLRDSFINNNNNNSYNNQAAANKIMLEDVLLDQSTANSEEEPSSSSIVNESFSVSNATVEDDQSSIVTSCIRRRASWLGGGIRRNNIL